MIGRVMKTAALALAATAIAGGAAWAAGYPEYGGGYARPAYGGGDGYVRRDGDHDRRFGERRHYGYSRYHRYGYGYPRYSRYHRYYRNNHKSQHHRYRRHHLIK